MYRIHLEISIFAGTKLMLYLYLLDLWTIQPHKTMWLTSYLLTAWPDPLTPCLNEVRVKLPLPRHYYELKFTGSTFWTTGISVWPTVDGWNPANQLMLVVHPIIYRVSYIPGGARFQPSTVWNEKNTVVPVERSLFAACAGCFCIVNVLPWRRKKNAFLCKVHLDRNDMDLYLSLASCFEDQKDNTHDCKVNVDDASDSQDGLV